MFSKAAVLFNAGFANTISCDPLLPFPPLLELVSNITSSGTP